MKLLPFLAAGVAATIEPRTVNIIDAGAQMSIEYSVEDGDLLVTQKVTRDTPTLWYRTTQMVTMIFIDPYPVDTPDDFTGVAYTGFQQLAKYYKEPMNWRDKGQFCKQAGWKNYINDSRCGWTVQNPVPDRYTTPN